MGKVKVAQVLQCKKCERVFVRFGKMSYRRDDYPSYSRFVDSKCDQCGFPMLSPMIVYSMEETDDGRLLLDGKEYNTFLILRP